MKAPRLPKELPPVGAENATCIGFVDLGTQAANVEGWDDARKCDIVFELADSKRKDGKPFILSKRFTFSSGPKSNLAKLLKSWLQIDDAKSFDMDSLLTKTALLTVTHSDDGEYANIGNISALPKNVKLRKPTTSIYSLYLNAEGFDEDVYNSLTDNTKQRIAASPEYLEMKAPKPSKADAKKAPAKKK